MTDYDATTKDLVESAPKDWLRLLKLPGDTVDIINADLATISTEADRVVRVLSPKPYLLHLEFQAGHDGVEVPERLLRYNVLLRYRHRMPVYSAVILLHSKADSPAITGAVQQVAPDGQPNLEFRYDAFRIWRQEPSDLLAGGLATLPLAPLAATKKEAASVIRKVKSRLTREASSQEARKLFSATYILMGLRFPLTFIDDLMEGALGMKESVTYQKILREGHEGGVEEGIEIGRAAEARSLILRLGGKRYGTPDDETERRLSEISNPEQLERLADRLFEAENWTEFWQ